MLVGVDDRVGTTEQHDGSADHQIQRRHLVVCAVVICLLSGQEATLLHARVVLPVFLDAEGVVDEVVVHIHLAHTERLDARVFHVLLEIRMEAQDLAHGTQYISEDGPNRAHHQHVEGLRVPGDPFLPIEV